MIGLEEYEIVQSEREKVQRIFPQTKPKACRETLWSTTLHCSEPNSYIKVKDIYKDVENENCC